MVPLRWPPSTIGYFLAKSKKVTAEDPKRRGYFTLSNALCGSVVIDWVDPAAASAHSEEVRTAERLWAVSRRGTLMAILGPGQLVIPTKPVWMTRTDLRPMGDRSPVKSSTMDWCR